MTLTPSQLHERLDTRGLLDTSKGPGTYALQVNTPDDLEAVAQAFANVSDVVPEEKTLARLTSDHVAYVGASNNVYDRLMDHADGEVRQTLFLRAFKPVDLVGVWALPEPFTAEYNRSVWLSQRGWTVWQDGRIV